jgi:hypothetical protein
MNLTYEQAKQAHESGKQIEFLSGDGDWQRCVPADFSGKAPSWVLKYKFRLADPYAELKAAHAAGKQIQHLYDNGKWADIPGEIGWNYPPDRYRVKPDAPTFEAGKKYRTRDGKKACVYTANGLDEMFPVVGALEVSSGTPRQWRENGAYHNGGGYSPLDLIAPWTDEPQPYDNWDKVPAWANWQAIDDCGFWRWFEQEPEKITPTHYFSVTGRMGGISSGTYPAPTNYTGTWEQSLQERPI